MQQPTGVIRWTYGLIKADGGMDALYSDGPIASQRIREALGGEFEYVHFVDETVAAVRKERAVLPPNRHWPNSTLRGDVILGRLVEGEYIGMMGVAIASRH